MCDALQIRPSGFRVYGVFGYSPQVMATAMAFASRSADPLDKSLSRVTEEKAEGFFEKYVGNYGHASVADIGHLSIAMENITQIDAFALWELPLVDGQERSTRYQQFTGHDCYRVPTDVVGCGEEMVHQFQQTADYCLEQYRFYSETACQEFRRLNPKPEGMSDRQYESTIRARAFDVARYWLFGAIKTTVNQTMSIRSLEKQIRKLLASPYSSVRELGQDLSDATMKDLPLTPQEVAIESPLAHGMAKYLEADRYAIERAQVAQAILAEAHPSFAPQPATEGVNYYSYSNLVSQYGHACVQASLLLYEYTNLTFGELLSCLSVTDSGKIVEAFLSCRGNHDGFPPAFGADREHLVEITMDIGGMRDLHRHRNCIQLNQSLCEKLGYSMPEMIEVMGLADSWRQATTQVTDEICEMRYIIDKSADYLIPFGFLRRSLYCMDTAELLYIAELRSRPSGHPSYRKISHLMWQAVCHSQPHLSKFGRVHVFQSDLEINILER